MLKVGDKVLCSYDGFGKGIVTDIHNTTFEKYQNHFFTVKFENRLLKTMCCRDKMITIFDDIKRPIMLIKD